MHGRTSNTSDKSRNRSVSFSKEEEKVRKGQDKRNDVKKPDKSRAKIQGDLLDLKFKEIFSTYDQSRGKYDHKSLKILNLNGNRITDIKLGGGSYKYYQLFSGSNHSLDLMIRIAGLIELNLSHNRLTEFLSGKILECTPHLRKLVLNDNNITVLPSESLQTLGQFSTIEELNLGSNNLLQIPAEIGLLTSLKSLKLSNNKLVALPREIVKLDNLSDPSNTFNIGGNALIEPQQLIAQQGGFDWICAYFQMNKPDENVSLVERYKHTIFLYHMHNAGKKGKVASTSAKKTFQLRLFVVGHAGTGKTTLIKHLRDSSSGGTHSGAGSTVTAARSVSSEECRTPLRGTPRHAANGSGSTNHHNNNSSSSSRRFELQPPGRLGSPSFELDGATDWASPDRTNSRPHTPCTAGSGDSHTSPLRTVSSPPPLEIHTICSQQQQMEAGIAITPWFPKKTALDKFLIPKTAETKKQEKQSKSLFSFHPEDVKFSIWDCAGAAEQHCVQKMFYSEFALQLVVFDLSRIETVQDVDVNVQYWIDLIQTHAPGASIVLAGTHADKLSVLEVAERIALVQQRVHANEASRVEDLNQEIKACRDRERKQRLCRLMEKRPCIDADIIALSNSEEASMAVSCLACRLVQLATPTKRTPHPCGIVGTEVPDSAQKIKKAILELRNNKQPYCTLVQLQKCFLKQSDLHNNPERAEHHSKLDGKMLRDTKTALAHLAKIGEIVWFDSNDSSSSNSHTTDTPVRAGAVSNGDADSIEPEHQFRPLTRSLTGDLETPTPRPPPTPSSSAVAANEIIFLDCGWLLRCVKTVLSRELLEDIRTVERFPLKYDDEAKREAESLKQAKSSALLGIIKWALIRNYLMRCGYEDKVVEVVRSVLEHYKVIIPIQVDPNRSNVQRSQSSSALSQSLSQSTSSKGGVTETALYPQAPITPIAHSRAHSLGRLSHSYSFSVVPPLALDRLLSTSSMQCKEEQHYLIPALVPKFEHNPIVPGLTTLERMFVFSHFAPPDLLPQLYAAVYTFPQKATCTQSSGSVLPATTSTCWDSAFIQEHGCCSVCVELLPDLTAEAAAGQFRLQFSSRLRIRGIGHVLNAQIILEHLEKYTAAVWKVLESYAGLGNVRLSSTCPSCLLHQTEESKRGEFRHSELSLLQKNFCMMSEKLGQTSRGLGSLPGKLQLELRKWNSKRHTCPFNRCQVKSDMLVHMPRNLKLALEAASQSEKEINFLLDEVVCSAAVPRDSIVNGVVKIMAVNTDQGEVAAIKRVLVETTVGSHSLLTESTVNLELSTGQYSSGVVVALPPGHPLRSGANRDGTDEVLVLACEHVITKAERVGGSMSYCQVGPQEGKQTIFIVGDAKNWLYMAELIFQGSLSAGSETNFWDMCALKIVAPIEPVLQRGRQALKTVRVLLPTVLVDSRRMYVSVEQLPLGVRTGPGSDAEGGAECIRLFHPNLLPNPVMHSIAVSARSVAVDQVVRRLGFPKFPNMLELSVDWGRVEQNDPNGDILISLLSDEGASGGPVVDREGELIGLLSRSHEYIRFSCVQQLRNLFDLLRDL